MDHFLEFIHAHKEDIRRIARQTRGEYDADDVENEAWLTADKVASKRGFPVDFRSPADCQQVLAWLYNSLVKFADKQLRYAVKLDKDWDRDDIETPFHALARLLTAADTSDPAVLLQRQQDVPVLLALARQSYSQASAYLLLLLRFEWDVLALAGHLCVVRATLSARIKRFGALTKYQPTLFDGFEILAPNFHPTLNRHYPRKIKTNTQETRQTFWGFVSP